MATVKNETRESKWVLCDNGVDVWHLSEVFPGCECTTGQPNQRIFNSEAEAMSLIPEQYRSVYLEDD